jgi:hypothetical protein
VTDAAVVCPRWNIPPANLLVGCVWNLLFGCVRLSGELDLGARGPQVRLWGCGLAWLGWLEVRDTSASVFATRCVHLGCLLVGFVMRLSFVWVARWLRALTSLECDVALAGGVYLIGSPCTYIGIAAG